MLKPRIVGVLIVRNDIVVQSIGFHSYLPVGRPEIAIEYLNRWGIDEIVVLDIDATPQQRRPKFEDIGEYSRHGQVPMSIGGGIRTVDDIARVVQGGADKVVINSMAVESLEFVTEGARLFGSQCIVVSIDARRTSDGGYEVFTCSGSRGTGMTSAEMAQKVEKAGAGEIFINSIDRDGSKQGYDMELVSGVVEAVNIPVVICGGVGHTGHLIDGLACDVSGIAAANFFHYTEHSVVVAKRLLLARDKTVRLDSYCDYEGIGFDESCRVKKIDDEILDQLRFEYVPEEII